MIEKEKESKEEGIAPLCEKQRELEPPPPYNPQFQPPVKPRRCVPVAGIYMVKEVESEDEETWKKAEMEIQGTFKGLQKRTRRGQEEQEEKERERGNEEDEAGNDRRSWSSTIDLPNMDNLERQDVVRKYLHKCPETGEHSEIKMTYGKCPKSTPMQLIRVGGRGAYQS